MKKSKISTRVDFLDQTVKILWAANRPSSSYRFYYPLARFPTHELIKAYIVDTVPKVELFTITLSSSESEGCNFGFLSCDDPFQIQRLGKVKWGPEQHDIFIAPIDDAPEISD